ncbi:MAG: hypothetical protein AB7D00_14945 [Rhodospirillaceae bacterium]
MNPGPFTLRELVHMARGRLESDWDRTATLLALIANVNRDPKRQRARRPEEFHPFRSRPQSGGVRITRQNIGLLKKVFIEKKGGRP